ncbi:hypothetical protein KAR48_06805 [bacterium]|nr:hypothetical protein [bacterium]
MASMDLNWAKQKWLLWVIAVVVTLFSMVYQRVTGPTYPVSGEVSVGSETVSYELLRTHEIGQGAPVLITVKDTSVTGTVTYRRLRSHDDWRTMPLVRNGDQLTALLPELPPAGKVAYKVRLSCNGNTVDLLSKPAVLRYKGAVPTWVIIPHVLFIFVAFLFANRTGLEAFDADGKAKRYMLWTIGVLAIGGFIFGPLMQQYAFGALWTGFPFGHDLTDNKALIAMLGWIFAWWRNRGDHDGRSWILVAAVLMAIAYLIPHSVMGSEFDFTQGE